VNVASASGGTSFKAKAGLHDDLVSAQLLIARMLDVILMWGVGPVDELKEYIHDDEIYDGHEEDDEGGMPIVI
jgi:hypothetical protein